MPLLSFGLLIVPSFFAMPFLLSEKWVTDSVTADPASRDLACHHGNIYYSNDVFGGRCISNHH